MFENEKKSPLERLRKGLYSRRNEAPEPVRHDIHAPVRPEVPHAWDEPNAPVDALSPIAQAEHPNDALMVAPKGLHPTHRFAYRVGFMIAALFCLAAFGTAAYTFFGGGNFVSAENVDILVEGPARIAGGDPVTLSVSVLNKNATAIELVDLIIDFPEGTKDPADPSQDLTRTRLSLGDIEAQGIAQRTVSALMFGEEGAGREIKFTAEYRTAGSNAIFFKEKVYKSSISSSPVLVSIDAPQKVIGGSVNEFSVTVTSNSPAPVRDLLLSLDYPFGVTVASAAPAAAYGDNVWRLGDLAPGAKKVVKVSLSVTGQDGEERAVRASVGIQSKVTPREIGTTIITQDHVFALERPFLGLDLALNGERADLATLAGQNVRAEILWTNNSGVEITGARIEAKLSGNVLDKGSVRVDNNGYYDSAANTIVWDSARAGLGTIPPGESGRVSFSLVPRSDIAGGSVSNPSIQITVSGSGSRTDENGVPARVESAASRSVKLVSNLALSARSLRSQGGIENRGPIPPRVDEESTYTIVWTVTNTSNTVTGARVSATLPPYVKWQAVTAPSDANITYNQATGEVVWVVGSVPANATVGSGAKQVAFQVAITPSANQVNLAPDLIGGATITGTDVFTGVTLKNTASALSTRTTTDFMYKPGDETVRQ